MSEPPPDRDELQALREAIDARQVRLGVHIRRMNSPGSPVYNATENILPAALVLGGSFAASALAEARRSLSCFGPGVSPSQPLMPARACTDTALPVAGRAAFAPPACASRCALIACANSVSKLISRGSASSTSPKARGENGCSGCSMTSCRRSRAAADSDASAPSGIATDITQSSSSDTSTEGGSTALSRCPRPTWLRCSTRRAESTRSRNALRSSARRWRSPARGSRAVRSNSSGRSSAGNSPSSSPSTHTTS